MRERGTKRDTAMKRYKKKKSLYFKELKNSGSEINNLLCVWLV